MSSQSSSDSSVVPPKLMETTITYQFVAAFYIDRNLIEIPSFYYRLSDIWRASGKPKNTCRRTGNGCANICWCLNAKYDYSGKSFPFSALEMRYASTSGLIKKYENWLSEMSPTTIDDDVDSEHDCNEHTTYDYENTGIDLEIPTYFFLSFHFCWTCGPSKLANSSLGATYNDIGDPGWKIIHCKAIMWYDERIMLWLWQNTTSSTRRSSTANETTTF
ncbi:hypothetical protein JHK82_054949 [Glycine max]|nr:hypothetical protein JHK86_054795 [Glycine max]KAG5073591.1 hypothetical protein JHK84_054822 [Glycine max]KAG5076254.1 hypothetical protein JHK82_054949 [Glycine max]